MSNTDASGGLSLVLIALMKGVMYRENDAAFWQSLLNLQVRVREYVGLLGLELILDEAEGYAYLRQQLTREGETDLPRLIPRHQLSYPVSLLLALLRKKLAESDANNSDSRLILSKADITDLLRLFLPPTVNEARFMDRIESDINRVIDMGFLRKLRGHDDQFEVRRILKAFVDAQWLNQLDGRLSEYHKHLSGGQADGQDIRG